eukprot:430067_1
MSNSSKKRKLENDSNIQPSKRIKLHSSNSSRCSANCGRLRFESTKCCNQCCEKPYHSLECDERECKNYVFKLLAFKSRDNTKYERSSSKYLIQVTDSENNNYYYRIWLGELDTQYVLIHPLKYVTNSPTINEYIEAFNYDTNLKNDKYSSHYYSHKDLVGKLFAIEIIDNIYELQQSKSLCEFITNKNAEMKNEKYHSMSLQQRYFHHKYRFQISNKNDLNSIFRDDIQQKMDKHQKCLQNMIPTDLLNNFPFSDIETDSSVVLTNCSGDTRFGVFYKLDKELTEFAKNNADKIDNENGYGFEWEYESDEWGGDAVGTKSPVVRICDLYDEYIYFSKLTKIFESKRKEQIFNKLYLEIEWNEQKQMVFYEAIMDGWKECNNDIINLMLKMIAPMLTAQDLKQRRLELWKKNLGIQ